MGEITPVCKEHVHTGRPHTRINNSIFQKSNVMSCQLKKQKYSNSIHLCK